MIELIEDSAPEADLSGIAAQFHPLARELGVELFRLVYAGNIFETGVRELVEASGHNPRVAVHLRILADQFNAVADQLMRDRGWTLDDVERVNRRVSAMLNAKIILPGTGRAGGDS